MTKGDRVALANDPSRVGVVVGCVSFLTDPPIPACDVRWHDGKVTTVREDGLTVLPRPTVAEQASDRTQYIVEAASVDRATIGPYDVMVWATVRANGENRPVLRQVFMDRATARKLAADIQMHFGK